MTVHTLLHYLESHGPIVLAVLLFLASVGVPVPASIIVIAAGAFARQGKFGWALAFALTLAGATLGSGGSYAMGRWGLKAVVNRLQKGRAWRRAEDKFRKGAAPAIVLTRFLITPLALPTNLIAGAEKYPPPAFLFWCAVGTAIWIGIYGGAGYLAGASWPWVQARIGQYAPWVLFAAAALFAGYELLVHARAHRHAPPGPQSAAAAAATAS